jgi:mRNA interferase HicA
MKRNKLIKYLEKNDCIFLREGSSHSIYRNIQNGKISTAPRHSDIKEILVRKICKDLGVPNALNL